MPSKSTNSTIVDLVESNNDDDEETVDNVARITTKKPILLKTLIGEGANQRRKVRKVQTIFLRIRR